MKDYFRYTRSPWPSYLFVLPLLALYQLAAVLANLGQRQAVINGADAWVQSLLSSVGLHGWLASALVLAALAGIVAYRADGARRREPVRLSYLWLLLLESTLYALMFGNVVAMLTSF